MSVAIDTRSRFSNLQRALSGYMPALDGLRGIAIIVVVWHNVTAGMYAGNLFERLLNLISNAGWVGVQLFFVLSGFLITGILLDEKGAPAQLKNFFIRRVLRIFPLYYVVLFAGFVVVPAIGFLPGWFVNDYQHQIWYWTYLINWAGPFVELGGTFAHFWSLAVEEQFYLLWPICVISLGPKALLRVCCLLIVAALAFRFGITALSLEFAQKAAYTFTIARWDALAVGASIALIVRDPRWFAYVDRIRGGLVSALLGYVLLMMGVRHNFAPVTPGVGACNQTVVAMLFGLWVLSAVAPSNANAIVGKRALLEHPALRFAGKYSYAIYIFHLPFNHLSSVVWSSWLQPLRQTDPLIGETLRAGFVFFCATALAFISWRILEQPCLNLKRYFPKLGKPASSMAESSQIAR